jgi:hypothetical protein
MTLFPFAVISLSHNRRQFYANLPVQVPFQAIAFRLFHSGR